MKDVKERIVELAKSDRSQQTIANILNREGYRQKTGARFSQSGVSKYMRTMGIYRNKGVVLAKPTEMATKPAPVASQSETKFTLMMDICSLTQELKEKEKQLSRMLGVQ